MVTVMARVHWEGKSGLHGSVLLCSTEALRSVFVRPRSPWYSCRQPERGVATEEPRRSPARPRRAEVKRQICLKSNARLSTDESKASSLLAVLAHPDNGLSHDQLE